MAAPTWPAMAQGDQPPTVSRFVLDNGLTLIVKPDHRSPTAVHMLWVRVGGYDEVGGESGISHMLEHMMFKGTDKLGPGEFSRRVAALGGFDNAFTTMDYTGYYQQVPAARLDDVMALEADVFAHNRFSDEDFTKENQVVQEERRMRTDDNPRALLREQQIATAFVQSPYHRPVVGWMSDIQSLTADDVRAWYRKWYVPGNAAVVVVGDVDPQKVLALARKTYGAIPARALPARKPRPEPAQMGLRRIEVKAPAEQAVVSLVFRVPKLKDIPGVPQNADALALTVLAGALDGYSGARLDRALTQGPDRVADGAGADNGLVGRGPQLFTLNAVVAQGKTAAQAEAGLRAQVARIAEHGVDESELHRIKTQWVASQVYKRDSVMGQAQELGYWWAEGFPLDMDERLVERVQNVTAAEVQSVAQKYFGDDQLTVATLVPQARSGQAARRAPAEGLSSQPESLR
jgi:zinc protease